MNDAFADIIAPLPYRPWVKGTPFKLLNSVRVAHVDIYAFASPSDGHVFTVQYSLGGKKVIAVDYWRYDPARDCMAGISDNALVDAERLYWHAGTDRLFTRVHKALVDRARAACTALLDIGRVSVHCHYVAVDLSDPWPRGWRNLAGIPADRRHAATRVRKYRTRKSVNSLPAPGNTLPDIL